MSPLLGALEPTELRLYRSETEIVRYAAAEGYIQVADNHAMLLVQEIHEPESSTSTSCARSCARPRTSSTRAGEDPRSGVRRCGTSAASRRSCGSPNRR